MKIPIVCVLCRREDNKRVVAFKIFNGTSLCEWHYLKAITEIAELEVLWAR